MAKVIGITGLPGAGKSTLLRCMRWIKVPCLSADQIVRDVLNNPPTDIKDAFPNAFLSGRFDKAQLTREVFQDQSKLDQLEDILHPIVYMTILDFIEVYKKDPGMIAVEVPLLFETSALDLFDIIVEAASPKEICQKRLVSRGWSWDRIHGAWGRYVPEEKRKALATCVIPTDQGKVKAWQLLKKSLEHLCKIH